MTTNERMNLYRYKHFQDTKTGEIRSPFHRGIVRNVVDFAQVRVPGCFPPDKRNWKHVYTVDYFDGNEILTSDVSNPQFV